MKTIDFSKAEWIWESDHPQPDEYIELKDTVTFSSKTEKTLKISADSNYAVYLNGALADFGQYSDFEDEKFGDVVNVSSYCKAGKNKLQIIVWYYGKDCSNYLTGKAGLLYELCEDGKPVSFSSGDSMVHPADGYLPHKQVMITSQLGLTFEYDAATKAPEYHPAFPVSGKSKEIFARPIKKTVLEDRIPAVKVFGGEFIQPDKFTDISDKMARSYLSFQRERREDRKHLPFQMESENGNNLYFIIDLQSEECGFLDFDIETEEACEIDIAYGEHLSDGRVRTYKRNFTCIYHAAPGRNLYLNPFRRFGCRYLQVFANTKKIKVNYFGLRPVTYPLHRTSFEPKSELRRKIYDASVKTLELCMHEHYEDCPWREQSLYSMDSRNQALCGYYAFNEFDFPRASFRLMGGHKRKDGTMRLCCPGKDDITIPSFNLVYLLCLDEYTKYSKDTTLIEEMYPSLQDTINLFLSRKTENGLITNLYGTKEDGYWGFFEWSETLGGVFGETERTIECPLNAFLSLALQSLSSIALVLGKKEESRKYKEEAEILNNDIFKYFYNKDDCLFETFSNKEKEKYSVLNNALCILCGAADKADTAVIEKILRSNNAGDTGLDVIPATLSMFIYRFDALLKINKKNASLILEEIDNSYSYMLDHGATTFWETMKGDADFDCVGSLCHGWSALPIYYYHLLEK